MVHNCLLMETELHVDKRKEVELNVIVQEAHFEHSLRSLLFILFILESWNYSIHQSVDHTSDHSTGRNQETVFLSVLVTQGCLDLRRTQWPMILQLLPSN